MREMVFRERKEKVAHLEAISKMISRIFGLDETKAFGHIITAYTSEVFQEAYDVDLLAHKAKLLREAQERIRARRKRDQSMITRLERMGEYYDREFGKDLKPK